MKQYTTPEQTAKLIELGFDRPKFEIETQLCNINGQPLRAATIIGDYSIGELIEMLDGVSELKITRYGSGWEAVDELRAFTGEELIDALYDMILKLNEEGVI